MEYSCFNVFGSPESYKHNDDGKIMTVVTIKLKLTLRELNDVLGKRSGVRVFALPSKTCKSSTYDLCTQADHFSEQAIFDLLHDLEFLLRQRDGVRQREAMRSSHSPKVVKRSLRKV